MANRVEERMSINANEPIARPRHIVLLAFKVAGFLLRPIAAPWAIRRQKQRRQRLRRDVLASMKWTMANVRPEIDFVPEGKRIQSRYTTIVLRGSVYRLRITKESYHEDFRADVAAECDPEKYWRIDVLAKAIGEMKLGGTRGERLPLVRTLVDLDGFVSVWDAAFKEYLSPDKYVETREKVEAYVAAVWRASGPAGGIE
jgi:hypothetical protein